MLRRTGLLLLLVVLVDLVLRPVAILLRWVVVRLWLILVCGLSGLLILNSLRLILVDGRVLKLLTLLILFCVGILLNVLKLCRDWL